MIDQSRATSIFSAMIEPTLTAAGFSATKFQGKRRQSAAVQWEKQENDSFVLCVHLQRGKTGRFYYLNLNLFARVIEPGKRAKRREAVLLGRLEELLLGQPGETAPSPQRVSYLQMFDCESHFDLEERERCIVSLLRERGLPMLEGLADYETIVEAYLSDCVPYQHGSFGILQPHARPYFQPVQGTYMAVLNLPVLGESSIRLTDDVFRQGRSTLLNVWSVREESCRASHAQLMDLSSRNEVDIYGIADRDAPGEVVAFLEAFGSPYVECGIDLDGTGCRAPCGDLLIDWRRDWCLGNMPLLMVIDGNGIERKLHCGVITAEVIEQEVLPAVEEARKPYNYVPRRARLLRGSPTAAI